MKQLPNILVADDNIENITLLEAVIRKLDVNLITAYSGQEALKDTRDLDLALAIIDVRMPEMNGYQLALKLNEVRPGVKVPIIFLTAGNFEKMKVFEAYDSGAVDYMFRPIDYHVLMCKITVFIDLYEIVCCLKNLPMN
jgi:CheY-like chemotaxis protein